MALADYGFGTSYEVSEEELSVKLSLEEQNTRSGYVLRASDAAAGFKARTGRIAMSVLLGGTGIFLTVHGDALVSAETTGSAMIVPIGLYLIVAAAVWLSALIRRPQELEVNQRGRCFHLIKRNLRGSEKSRETIRFEEVVKISMIDNLASLDMRASAMNWDMGRIDVTWRQNKVTPMIIGDVAELEPLLKRLRSQVGMA